MSDTQGMSTYLLKCIERLELSDYTLDSGAKCIAGEGLFYDLASDEKIGRAHV